VYIFEPQARSHYVNARRDLVRWVEHSKLPDQNADREVLTTIDAAVHRVKATKLEVFIVMYACDPKSTIKQSSRYRHLEQDRFSYTSRYHHLDAIAFCMRYMFHRCTICIVRMHLSFDKEWAAFGTTRQKHEDHLHPAIFNIGFTFLFGDKGQFKP